ncbi:adenosylcobinamide-GDP ribazoletransferase [Caloramator australicus]|nr:adenosylcobinamide-GDP ribazoletransferase [Caloramator australicus]
MIKAFILSLQFLTRLPVNIKVDFNESTIKKMTFFFPFVGAIIAMIINIPFMINKFNKELEAFFSLALWIFITGGLHIDGLSDTCDGFFSGRDKEKILDIMKDSRVGTFGVIAIVFDILSKFLILKNLSRKSSLIALILALGWARLFTSFLFTYGKSARKDGLGSLFTGRDRQVYFIFSVVIFGILSFVLAGSRFFILLIIGILNTLLVMRLSYKKIEGLTGDIYGASIELNEIVLLLSWVVLEWIYI